MPDLGRWLIPAIRPLNATWTGGTTTVILDSRHVVAECVERRPPAVRAARTGERSQTAQLPGGGAAAGRRACLRQTRDRSVVPLTRATLRLGSPCRLECQLDWTASAALDPEVEIDLSPGWTAERVVMRGSSEPLQSHATVLPTGITRLQVVIPASALPGKELSFLIAPRAIETRSLGPLDLPRVSVGGATWRMTRGWRGPIKGRSSGPWRRAAWPGSIRARSPACCLLAPLPNVREVLGWRGLTRAAGAGFPRADRIRAGSFHRDEGDGRPASEASGSMDESPYSPAPPIESVPIWVERPMGSPDSLVFDDSVPGQPRRSWTGRSAGAGLPEGGYAARSARQDRRPEPANILFSCGISLDVRAADSDDRRLAQVPPAGVDRGQDSAGGAFAIPGDRATCT